jgi:hypothetical protein
VALPLYFDRYYRASHGLFKIDLKYVPVHVFGGGVGIVLVRPDITGIPDAIVKFGIEAFGDISLNGRHIDIITIVVVPE